MPLVTEPREVVYVRKPRPTDQGYIAATWVRALIDGGYEGDAGKLVDRMLDRSDVRILVACGPAELDSIVGWLAYTPVPSMRLLHFVYVRAARRGRGIADQLRTAAWPAPIGDLAFTMRGRMAKSLTGKYCDAIHIPVEDFLK